LNPLWKKSYDENGVIRSKLSDSIGNALAGTGGKYLNGDAEFTAKPADFTDAIHLRWTAAQRFTDTVIDSGILW
jgi:hypothetical protein